MRAGWPRIPGSRRSLTLAWLGVLLLSPVWLGGPGCSPNEPFDPNSLENRLPTVRLFVDPVDPDVEFNPTSYFARTFFWSGSDPDGWVTEFHVSIRLEQDVPALWDTTTATDTTMTFVTDEQGEAEATFLIACRDNRGAMSDTLVRFIPLKNYPPEIQFQSDFEPLINMQREFIYAGEAVVDTVYWNWGSCNFRLLAFDQDGVSTMADHFRYTLAETEPQVTWDHDDPLADPEIGWIRQRFPVGEEETRKFEIFIAGAEASPSKRLTVSVLDEAAADSRFTYEWEVRAPQGPVLYIPDNTPPEHRALYAELLDDLFGTGQWDSYDFWFGYPDHDSVLLETMRSFELVLWTDGGSTSQVLEIASGRGRPLDQYVNPTDDSAPGRLMMVSRAITGTFSGLSVAFRQDVLGIKTDGSPPTVLGRFADADGVGQPALSPQLHLPGFAARDTLGLGIGLQPYRDTSTEVLYQMQECSWLGLNPLTYMMTTYSCYQDASLQATPHRPPYDPVVAVRTPLRTTESLAQVVVFSIEPYHFVRDEVLAALSAVITSEMGVSSR